MIAMQMAEKNNIKSLRVKTGLFPGQQGSWPAVQKKEAI